MNGERLTEIEDNTCNNCTSRWKYKESATGSVNICSEHFSRVKLTGICECFKSRTTIPTNQPNG